jgi:regulator of sirC expression with transglutaminase-like and TPR domain
MGLGDRAIEEFHRVLTMDPLKGIAVFNLGVVFYGQGAIDSARYYMSEYLRMEPEGRASQKARELIDEMGT